ncbi:MAG TPA: ATP-binding cassette domain-containing protein [Solirubrobacterales bacterium]|nr:ATP-binding cassette domain-containing protein [Solirubrobacterales bacterium]
MSAAGRPGATSTGRSAILALLAEGRRGPPLSRRLLKAGAIAVLTFALGAALLGLAGWFIASSAVAGLAVASTFSFVYPSAGVQGLAVARTLSRYQERISTHSVTLDIVGWLRGALFGRALRLPRDRVAALRSSDLLGRITVDTDAVEEVLLRSAFPAIVAVGAVVAAGVFFLLVSPTLAVISTAGSLLTAAVLIALARRQARSPAQELIAARAEARAALVEALDGLPELRSFGAERLAAADVTRHLGAVEANRRRLTRLGARGQSLGGLLADLTLVVVVAAAAGLLGSAQLSAPVFVMACLVAIAVFEPFVGLSGAVVALERGRAAAARLSDLFPAAPEPGTARHRWPEGPVAVKIGLAGRPDEIDARAGDTVLLSGRSGAGKSTLLRAITGERSPAARVLLSGIPAAEIDATALTGHVTLVAQDAHVFDGTIRQNLQLADEAADEVDLWGALGAAALSLTVAAFPNRLDTPVGPGGAALSGGQRRRLSVAQGLLRQPDILLLDEPTEGLDTATATRLLAGVRDYLPGALVIIALHDRQSPLPWSPTTRIAL